MKSLVVGAGATGGYFGARLARAGHDVTFLVRPARAEHLRTHGLRITGLTELHLPEPQLVTADELTAADFDLVLLSVKATALDRALDDLAPAVGPGTAIVPLLNGLAHLDVLNARFGPTAVLGGVAKVVTTLGPEGEIVQLAPPVNLTLGEQDGHLSERVTALRTALTEAGVPTDPTPDVLAAMWHKWVFITTLATVTGFLRGTVGEVGAVPGGTAFAEAVLAECSAVAEAAGRPVPAAELAATRAVVTAPGSPLTASLARDVLAGRHTEVEHLLGDLTARARTLGVPTPLLDVATLHLRVHQLRAGAGS
ncbi:ketopantoate reductase family protein [Kitasatospora sp. NPDC096147]|uniref:ketopantoate reductase family protein n=1 Tax=Kitasatospora sp. NPDC096147 TaxID=3364093 RepID=UPI00380B4E83